MSREEVLTLLQRFAVEPWSTGDVEALDDLVTDDYTLQGGAGGLEHLKQVIRDTRADCSGVTVTISDVIVEDDRLAYRWTMSGTHQGEHEAVPGTGKPVTFTGITMLRLRDGKVAEDQFESSSPSAQQQLEQPSPD
jgi:predicted ester cyclase